MILILNSEPEGQNVFLFFCGKIQDVADGACCRQYIYWMKEFSFFSLEPSPLTKSFNPHILRRQIDAPNEQLFVVNQGRQQSNTPCNFKFNPNSQSPFSLYPSNNLHLFTSQHKSMDICLQDIEKKAQINDKINQYSEQEDNDFPVTPVKSAGVNSQLLDECDINTTGKKSEPDRTTRQRKARPKDKGLRQLSWRVFQIIKKLQNATYKDVAEKLVQELKEQSAKQDEKQEQNVKRRVYDALNVLISLGVLVKDGRKIICASHQIFQSQHEDRQKQVQQLQKVMEKKMDYLQQQRQRLHKVGEKYRMICNLMRRNQELLNPKAVKFPYIGVILQTKGAIKKLNNKQDLQIESAFPISIFGDVDSIGWINDEKIIGQQATNITHS